MKSRARMTATGWHAMIAAVAGTLMLSAAAALSATNEIRVIRIAALNNGIEIAWDAEPPHTVIARAATPGDDYQFISPVVTGHVAVVPPDGPVATYRVRPAQPVFFPDTNLNALVRAAITNKLAPLDTMYDVETESVTTLDLINRNISDISGIQFTGLPTLNLSLNRITALEPLRTMHTLTRLDVFDNDIASLEPLAGLSQLTALNFSYNRVSDLAPLTNITALTRLVGIANDIADLQPLRGLTNLTWLQVPHNRIEQVQPLAPLVGLDSLLLANNLIQDIDGLTNNPGIAEGDLIDLQGNPLSAKARAVDIPALTNRGVFVLFDAPP